MRISLALSFILIVSMHFPALLRADEIIGGIACPNGRVTPANPPVGAVILNFENGEFTQPLRFFPLGKKNSRRPLRCALGDVDGDGIQDIITVPGAGLAPTVRIFDGESRESIAGDLAEFDAFDPTFRGGVFVAAGDVNGDGRDDIITAAGAETPRVNVIDAANGDQICFFDAYESTFTGGVRVAAGDIDGDGFAEVVTAPGPGIQPEIKVFNGRNGFLISSFFAYDSSFTGGVFVTLGDANGDARLDIITGAGPGSVGPEVKIFNELNGSLITSFFAYPETFRGGVSVSAGDVNNDGIADIITAPSRAAKPEVRVFGGDTQTQLDSIFAYRRAFRGGVFVGQ